MFFHPSLIIIELARQRHKYEVEICPTADLVLFGLTQRDSDSCFMVLSIIVICFQMYKRFLEFMINIFLATMTKYVLNL